MRYDWILRFLGIDFGWQSQPSGVAALDWDGNTLHLAELNRLNDPKDIVAWVQASAGDEAVIGIDAPIVIPNKTGMRVADRLMHSFYGKYHAGAYPASRAREFWKRTTGLSSSLLRLGFSHGDELQPRTRGRFQIEIHPHAAAVQLFALDRIVKYKKGKLAERARELARLRGLILDRLPLLMPRLAATELPEIPKAGGPLKAVEDQIDALLAAYIAAYWWYWGRERNEVHGNSKDGYIVVPHRSTPDPIQQFQQWFREARASGIKEPSAMTLATVSADGQPSARMVLLRDANQDGFVFFTNYRSRKGRELAANPRAALVLYWQALGRQVRVTGQVSKTSRAETEAYFRTRPRGAQIGAWASWQSSVIPDRNFLEQRVQKLEQRFSGEDIPAPPEWGGYRLRPDTIELWEERQSRLHDRVRYTRNPDESWTIERLAP